MKREPIEAATSLDRGESIGIVRRNAPVGPAHYAALRRLAVEQAAAAADPDGRDLACRAWIQLAEDGIGATPAEVRAQKAALVVLLGDRRLSRRSKHRICDVALMAAGRPGCVRVEDLALTDRHAEQLRGELERELAGP